MVAFWDGRENELPLLPPRNPELLLPNEREFAPAFAREGAEKKCCEFDGALRNEAGFAARPAALKLPRDGLAGTLPLSMLLLRKEAALMRS